MQNAFTMWSIDIAILSFEYISITTIFACNLFQLTLQQRTSIAIAPPPQSPDVPRCEHGGFGSSCIISHDSNDSLRDTQLILIETITKQSLLIVSPFIRLVLFALVMILLHLHHIMILLILEDIQRQVLLQLKICLGGWLSFSFANKEYKLCCNLQQKTMLCKSGNSTIKTQQTY